MAERVYHHYTDLEEFHAGMWRIVRGDVRRAYVLRAAEIMRDPQRFEEGMRDALTQWPKSCAHNLSCDAANRLAWLGHAGCCLLGNCPEEATRCGWHQLSPEEQAEANRVALVVLTEWLREHAGGRQLVLL